MILIQMRHRHTSALQVLQLSAVGQSMFFISRYGLGFLSKPIRYIEEGERLVMGAEAGTQSGCRSYFTSHGKE